MKKVNFKIERKQCPEFTVEVFVENGSLCLNCSQKALGPGENGLNIWYQNRECVPYCSGEYAIYDQVNHYCANCDEKTYINGQTVCGCLMGTVKSPLDGVCYLPEDSEIKKALLKWPNILCYKIDGITHNYCKNESTSKCEIVFYFGTGFPTCHCKDGYAGKYCENKINEINLNNNIDDVLNITSDIIDEKDPVVISKIRGINYFIEKDNSYINNIDINKIDMFVETSINSINNAINEKNSSPQIFDVIETTVHFLLYKINNSKRLRLLEEEEDNNKENLKFILKNSHYLNYLANSKSGTNYNIQNDKLNLISFVSYKVNAIDNSFKTYINNLSSSNSTTGYINFNNNKADENSMVILTMISKKLY